MVDVSGSRATPSSGVDHGSIGGLTDRDHPQYGIQAPGTIIADNIVYSTITAAIAALTGGGVIYLGIGTYNEKIDINQNDIILQGSGWSTIIHETTESGHQITVSGDRCQVRNLKTFTTPAGGNVYNGIYITGADCAVIHCLISSSDNHGIHLAVGNTNGRVINTHIDSIDGGGIRIDGPNNIISNNLITNVANVGISLLAAGDNGVIVNNIINTTGDDGILINVDCEDCLIDSNRITNWTNEAIDDDSATSTVGDNEVT